MEIEVQCDGSSGKGRLNGIKEEEENVVIEKNKYQPYFKMNVVESPSSQSRKIQLQQNNQIKKKFSVELTEKTTSIQNNKDQKQQQINNEKSNSIKLEFSSNNNQLHKIPFQQQELTESNAKEIQSKQQNMIANSQAFRNLNYDSAKKVAEERFQHYLSSIVPSLHFMQKFTKSDRSSNKLENVCGATVNSIKVNLDQNLDDSTTMVETNNNNVTQLQNTILQQLNQSFNVKDTTTTPQQQKTIELKIPFTSNKSQASSVLQKMGSSMKKSDTSRCQSKGLDTKQNIQMEVDGISKEICEKSSNFNKFEKRIFNADNENGTTKTERVFSNSQLKTIKTLSVGIQRVQDQFSKNQSLIDENAHLLSEHERSVMKDPTTQDNATMTVARKLNDSLGDLNEINDERLQNPKYGSNIVNTTTNMTNKSFQINRIPNRQYSNATGAAALQKLREKQQYLLSQVNVFIACDNQQQQQQFFNYKSKKALQPYQYSRNLQKYLNTSPLYFKSNNINNNNYNSQEQQRISEEQIFQRLKEQMLYTQELRTCQNNQKKEVYSQIYQGIGGSSSSGGGGMFQSFAFNQEEIDQSLSSNAFISKPVSSQQNTRVIKKILLSHHQNNKKAVVGSAAASRIIKKVVHQQQWQEGSIGNQIIQFNNEDAKTKAQLLNKTSDFQVVPKQNFLQSPQNKRPLTQAQKNRTKLRSKLKLDSVGEPQKFEIEGDSTETLKKDHKQSQQHFDLYDQFQQNFHYNSNSNHNNNNTNTNMSERKSQYQESEKNVQKRKQKTIVFSEMNKQIHSNSNRESLRDLKSYNSPKDMQLKEESNLYSLSNQNEPLRKQYQQKEQIEEQSISFSKETQQSPKAATAGVEVISILNQKQLKNLIDSKSMMTVDEKLNTLGNIQQQQQKQQQKGDISTNTLLISQQINSSTFKYPIKTNKNQSSYMKFSEALKLEEDLIKMNMVSKSQTRYMKRGKTIKEYLQMTKSLVGDKQIMEKQLWQKQQNQDQIEKEHQHFKN